jgi:hypothetical protein
MYLLEIENEYIVNLQSRSIARYYFKRFSNDESNFLIENIMKSKNTKSTLDFLNSYLSY